MQNLQPLVPVSIGVWMLALGLAGCPPRETLIEISRGGAATLLNSCGAPPLDVTKLCNALTAGCDQADASFDAQCRGIEAECHSLEEAQAEATCRVPGLMRPPSTSASTAMATRIVLVTVDDDGPKIRDASDCGPVNFDCKGPFLDEGCATDALNDGIAAAIPNGGLGFDGLDEAEDAIPVVLMFHDLDGDGSATCTDEELFACGALDQRIPGEDNYDLVCASCQSGPAATVESAPCFTNCFLSICAEVTRQLNAMSP